MIAELGQYALILALCLAVAQAFVPLFGLRKQDIVLLTLPRYTALGQCFLVGLSMVSLAYAFLTNDFSISYVAANSNTQLPWMYRIGAVWGAHEGSMLLWVFILSLWTAAAALWSRRLPILLVARVLVVLAWVAIGFYVFILWTSNPFARLFPPMEQGVDLNPLLQDPGLMGHPPLLYLGYVGFSVAFAFAVAALWMGQWDAKWAAWVRPWAEASWCFLTLGIVLGSWWAYRELGWGGWWFWDPVENASFMPWLSGTALLHSLIVNEKRGLFRAWTALLAMITFSLSLLGTFLVRSGVLVSVHSFAADPKRGSYILAFLFCVVGGSLLLYAIRGKRLAQPMRLVFWSRETMILLNNMFLVVAMLAVLLGTIYPVIAESLGFGRLSVGAPYFNAVFVPIILPLFVGLGLVSCVNWDMSQPKVWLKLWLSVGVVVALLALLLICWVGNWSWTAWLGLSAALWVLLMTGWRAPWRSDALRPPSKNKTRIRWPMVIAHIGVAVTAIGIVLVTVGGHQKDVALAVGETTVVHGDRFTLKGVVAMTGPNYTGLRATVAVSRGVSQIALLYPEARLFNASKTVLAKAAINMRLDRDLYVALGESIGHGVYGFRIYDRPFVRFIWAGGLLMVLGGLLGVGVLLRARIK